MATFFSLALIAGLVLGAIAYARRSKPPAQRRDAAPTLIPADSTDFQPSTLAAPATRREPREFDDSE